MAARRLFTELFSSKSQADNSVEQDLGRRRVSISHSGRFKQKNMRRKEIQKDTFVPVPQDNRSKIAQEQDDRGEKL